MMADIRGPRHTHRLLAIEVVYFTILYAARGKGETLMYESNWREVNMIDYI